MSLLVLKLGRDMRFQGGKGVYAIMNDATLLDIFTAEGDTEALKIASKQSAGRNMECEPGLAVSAKVYGYPIRELSSLESINRAHCSLSVFAQEAFDGLEQPEVLLDFFEAASVFQQATQNDNRQWTLNVEISGILADIELSDQQGVLVDTGNNPSISIMTTEDLSKLLDGEARIDDINCFVVVFEEHPEPVVRALRDAYGLNSVPTPYVLVAKQRFVPNKTIVAQFSAIMKALGHFMATGETMFAWKSRLGGSLEVQLDDIGFAD